MPTSQLLSDQLNEKKREVANLRKSSSLLGDHASHKPRERGQASANHLRSSCPSLLTIRQPGTRPVAYVCYLCGQQFGSQSLFIHIPQCQKKWVATQKLKDPASRRPMPPPPAELALGRGLPLEQSEVEAFNSRMFEYWNEISLVRCHLCGRTFLPESLEVHIRSCRGGKGSSGPAAGSPPTRGSRTGLSGQVSGPVQVLEGGSTAQNRRSVNGRPGITSKPRAFTCYLCGQQYGSQSLTIHIKQCQKRWQEVEAQKPTQQRRPLPPSPAELNDPLPTAPSEIDNFNQRMIEVWDSSSLVSCPHCCRTFREDAFARHEKVCTAERPGGPLGIRRVVQKNMGAISQPCSETPPLAQSVPKVLSTPHRPRAYVCYLCGQQYGHSSLVIHIPRCLELWLKREMQKPSGSQRQPPDMPSVLDQPLPTHPDEVEMFNQQMMGIFNSASLVPCRHCGRTFTETALLHHQKHCTVDAPMVVRRGKH